MYCGPCSVAAVFNVDDQAKNLFNLYKEVCFYAVLLYTCIYVLNVYTDMRCAVIIYVLLYLYRKQIRMKHQTVYENLS